jgi:hypothetical protein
MAAVVGLWIASAALRLAMYDSRENVANLDATYHVLLTVRALQETPASTHRFLPLVTLGASPERGIPFGSTIPDANGLYYYASFPPAGFLAPYVFFAITHLPLTPFALMLFNLGVHLAATILLCVLVRDALVFLCVSEMRRNAAVLLSAATYLFSTESLYGHGIIYWHHSLFQVAWIAQLVFLARLLRERETGVVSRRTTIGLLATSFLGPSIEWTGYLCDATIAAALWWIDRRSLRRLALGVLAAAVLAGALFLVHIASVVGMTPVVDALRHRFTERSAAHGSLVQLAIEYFHSFSLLPLLALIALFSLFSLFVKGEERLPKAVVVLLVVATVPLIENLLLMQHATQYGYDRLKALIPICLVLGLALVRAQPMLRRGIAVAWVLLIGANIAYRADRTRDISSVLANDGAVLRALDRVTKPCTIFAVPSYARAWVYLTVGHNVAERVPNADSLRALTIRHGACQGVLLTGDVLGNQIYDWRGAVVFDPPNSVRVLTMTR